MEQKNDKMFLSCPPEVESLATLMLVNKYKCTLYFLSDRCGHTMIIDLRLLLLLLFWLLLLLLLLKLYSTTNSDRITHFMEELYFFPF